MPLSDALTITLLGMAVVFCGLLLTATLIWSFSAVPAAAARIRRGTSPGAATVDPVTDTPPVPPEILAVITTVLEIERRLYRSDPGGRLTITRHNEVRES